jgi:hypothetical protein
MMKETPGFMMASPRLVPKWLMVLLAAAGHAATFAAVYEGGVLEALVATVLLGWLASVMLMLTVGGIAMAVIGLWRGLSGWRPPAKPQGRRGPYPGSRPATSR